MLRGSHGGHVPAGPWGLEGTAHLYILYPSRPRVSILPRGAGGCSPSPDPLVLPMCFYPSDLFWNLCPPRSYERCTLLTSHPQTIFLK